MSKLIVEMEMPRFCAECPMCDNVYYGDDVRKSFCVVFDERKEILTEDMPSWCPIKGEISEIELMHLEEERAFAARNIAAERKDDEQIH
jgi:hypothetical protein